MTKLGELYGDFSRIDLDACGGYARVAQVKTQGQEGYPEHCAFKLMRHEIDYQKGMDRFEDELHLLAEITSDSDAPFAITRIYDSGFVPIELSQSLEKHETLDLELEILSSGVGIQEFLDLKLALETEMSGRWLPYLVVEQAPYDDSLFRQIQQQPAFDPSGIFRLPTGEVILMALQLLEVMDYLHANHHRVYIDWKPEHIFWSGLHRRVKLVDWNVTVSLDDGSGEMQNIRDDLRLFCAVVLYIGLTFVDPDAPNMPIGPRPSTEIHLPVSQVRRRYWTDKPKFYQREASLDRGIREIIQRGLDPKQGFDSTKDLRKVLFAYAREELGMMEEELDLYSEQVSPYYKALMEMRLAQQQLLQAQKYLIEAIRFHGKKSEFTRLFDAIKRALLNFPAS